MDRQLDTLLAAYDKQNRFQQEAELDRQAREAHESQSEDKKSLKQHLGEQLINLGQRLTQQPEKA